MVDEKRKPTQEEIQRGLLLLEREKVRKEREALRRKNMTPEMREAKRRAARRLRARTEILLKKAAKAGITVSPQEIDEHLAAEEKRKK
jgi:hypothetical protein